MTTLMIANNCTRESGSFMGDQLCSLKAAYLFVQNEPAVDRVIMSASRANEMHFLWEKFVADPRGDGGVPPATVVWDDWNPGDWSARWGAWDRWRTERRIAANDGLVLEFDIYKELYLRIHGAERQRVLCGFERGMDRRNIFEYWVAGQENCPTTFRGADWFDDTLIRHPPHRPERDVYISPQAKTQGNLVFTFDFWADVVRRLLAEAVSVTVGYDGPFCDWEFGAHPLYRKHWGTHEAWMAQICGHRLVACGNTGTGWLAAACGVPMVTVEPHNSVMADHRYRECGLRNLVEVVDGAKLDGLGNDMELVAAYVARRIVEHVRRRVVMTTGCYDILHAGHVRHLERSRALGTRLVVALNSDDSVRMLKGTVEGVGRPINPHGQRKAVLEALRCVDEVRLFDGVDALDLIREIRPDVLTAGYGYDLSTIVGRDVVEGYGGRVVATCPGDARNDPAAGDRRDGLSTTATMRRMRAGNLADTIRLAAIHSVNPVDKLKFLAEQYLSVAAVPGAVADLGSYRGGTALVLRRLGPDRELYLFDTWRGNPHDDPLCHHKKGEWAAPLADCRALVGDGPLTCYVSGVFPESAESADLGLFAFVYVDLDTYQATRAALEFFWPRLAPGGKLVADDYGWEPCAGVKKAVDEMFSNVEVEMFSNAEVVGYTCAITRRA